MAYPWKHTVFRSPAGTAPSFPPGDETTVVTSGVAYDPVAGYGMTNGASPSFGNISVDGAIDPLLGGYAKWSGSGMRFQRDLHQAGRCLVKAAVGTAQTLVVLEGTTELIDKEFGGVPSTLWLPNTAYNIALFVSTSGGTTVFSSPSTVITTGADPAIWVCVASGTSGATPPSGGSGGDTIVDGTVTWRRHELNVLAAMNKGATGTGTILNASDTVVSVAGWGAATRVGRISGRWGNSFTIVRNNLTQPSVRDVSVGFTPEPLGNVRLYSDKGDDVGTAPTFWCNQVSYYDHPDGLRYYRIAPSSGPATLASLKLAGTRAQHFDLIDDFGSIWIVPNDNLLPDSAAGAGVIYVDQTDPDAAGATTYRTTLNCTFVSSQGKPTDKAAEPLLARISAQAWLIRKGVKDKHLSAAAYNGQPFLWKGKTNPFQMFAQTFNVSGRADWAAQFAGFVPDGVSWYRVNLGAGDYAGTGDFTSLSNKNFGTGGLFVTRAAGADPFVNLQFKGVISGVHFDDVTFPCTIRNAYTFSTSLGANGVYTRYRVTNSRIGGFFDGHPLDSLAATDNNSPTNVIGNFAAGSGQSVEVQDCYINGISYFMLMAGMYCMSVHYNRKQNVLNDFYRFGLHGGVYEMTDVFGEPRQYIDSHHNVADREVDFPGFPQGPHADHFQMLGYYAGSTTGVNSTHQRLMMSASRKAIFHVGEWAINAPGMGYPSEVFRVKAVRQDADIPPGITGRSPVGPVGTDPASWQDGGVEWERVTTGPVVPLLRAGDGEIWMNWQSDMMMSASPFSNITIDRNEEEDGTKGLGQFFRMCKIDVFQGSVASNGLSIASGEIYSEFCTSIGPCDAPLGSGGAYNTRFNTVGGGVPRYYATAGMTERCCIIGAPGSGNNRVVSYNGYYINLGNENVDPHDIMPGPFVLKEGDPTFWVYPSLPTDGSPTTADYVAQLRSMVSGHNDALGAGILPAVFEPPVPTGWTRASLRRYGIRV